MRLARSIILPLLALALGAPGGAHAQEEPSTLARALLARYPAYEIVPQSCASEGRALVVGDRLCLIDTRTGMTRAVRRIALGDGVVEGALRGTDVFFATWGMGGGPRTRFWGRMWRWVLQRDGYLGLGNLPVDPDFRVVDTTFGVLYRMRPGWFVTEGGTARPVRVAEDELRGTFVVVDGRTFLISPSEDSPVVVQGVELEGDAVRLRMHTTVPGSQLFVERDVVVTRQLRGGVARLRVLRLPAAESVEIVVPAAARSATRAVRLDAHRVLLSGRRTPIAVLDLHAGTVDTADVPAPPSPTPLLRASSLMQVQPSAEGGLYVGRMVGGWRLDASGASRVRRGHPRAPRATCACEETTLRCGGGAMTVPDACTEVPELDHITDEWNVSSREPLFTADGRFRIDRLEADLVRVTRLRDGARLWVRMFDDALFAQVDDGGYFVSDRALTARMAIRDGRGLLTDPIAPLAARADALFRPELVRDFFAPPATAP